MKPNLPRNESGLRHSNVVVVFPANNKQSTELTYSILKDKVKSSETTKI